MNSHKGESLKITGEIPVSLNLLSVANGLTVTYLKVKGLFYFLIGLTWIFFRSPSREAGIAWVDFLSPYAVGFVWCIAGLASISAGYLTSHTAKRLGFFILIIVPAILGSYFLISWFLYVTPFADVEGYQRGAITTASYWAYSASAYIMARVYASTSGGIEDASIKGRV